MTLNYQEVREQVKRLGENAVERHQRLQDLLSKAKDLLQANAAESEALQRKVRQALAYEGSLRCALPATNLGRPPECLDDHFPLPQITGSMNILAADGSQIAPDRHSPVNYCLINVGAIQMRTGTASPPQTFAHCQLFYDEDLFVGAGFMSDSRLALLRDLSERNLLAEQAEKEPAGLITFTDGPMELWGSKDAGEAQDFQEKLEAYKKVLRRLNELGAVTAGYVDKPGANLMVRLLEVSLCPPEELPGLRDFHPLRGVTDMDLFLPLLASGERSAVFAMQSQSAKSYSDSLALHFFYLNVGPAQRPWLARVEIPAWVASNEAMLNSLHAALVEQSRILGSRPYPYLLHRAHEAAVVTLEEKEQVTTMILQELRRRGIEPGSSSNKQAAKDLGPRTPYRG